MKQSFRGRKEIEESKFDNERLMSSLQILVNAALSGNIGQMELQLGRKKIRIVSVPEGFGDELGDSLLIRVPLHLGQTQEVQ